MPPFSWCIPISDYTKDELHSMGVSLTSPSLLCFMCLNTFNIEDKVDFKLGGEEETFLGTHNWMNFWNPTWIFVSTEWVLWKLHEFLNDGTIWAWFEWVENDFWIWYKIEVEIWNWSHKRTCTLIGSFELIWIEYYLISA